MSGFAKVNLTLKSTFLSLRMPLACKVLNITGPYCELSCISFCSSVQMASSPVDGVRAGYFWGHYQQVCLSLFSLAWHFLYSLYFVNY